MQYRILAILIITASAANAAEATKNARQWGTQRFHKAIQLYEHGHRWVDPRRGLHLAPDRAVLVDPERCVEDPSACNLYGIDPEDMAKDFSQGKGATQ